MLKANMKVFKEKLESNWQEILTKRIASWMNFIIRILILVFVVMIIRFFASPDTDKFRDFLNFWKSNQSDQSEKEIVNKP